MGGAGFGDARPGFPSPGEAQPAGLGAAPRPQRLPTVANGRWGQPQRRALAGRSRPPPRRCPPVWRQGLGRCAASPAKPAGSKGLTSPSLASSSSPSSAGIPGGLPAPGAQSGRRVGAAPCAGGTGKRLAPVEVAARKEDGSVVQRVLAFWQWGLIVSADSPGMSWWLSRDNCDFSQYPHLCFKPRFESAVVTSLLYIAYYEEQKLSHLFYLTSCFEYFGSSFAVSVAFYKAEKKS